ncbi:hypothetical protein KHQ81_14325 [Mycoplasmatota bacterium]|nr:hypothetical protein KHQ81_14325 [Mycoplasmatota bacterium]
MNKILILGSSGSGKSTLANRLGKTFNIEVLHLDIIFWEENWKICNKLVYLTELEEWLQKKQYIIDGNHNYGDSLKTRIVNADTIIFLNYNRMVCLYGAIKRYFKYKNKTRPSMKQGCDEKIDFEFVKYILWDYPKKKKKLIFPLIENEFKGQCHQFKTRKALNKFIKKLGVMVE